MLTGDSKTRTLSREKRDSSLNKGAKPNALLSFVGAGLARPQ